VWAQRIEAACRVIQIEDIAAALDNLTFASDELQVIDAILAL
jgi:hypothetical protein